MILSTTFRPFYKILISDYLVIKLFLVYKKSAKTCAYTLDTSIILNALIIASSTT